MANEAAAGATSEVFARWLHNQYAPIQLRRGGRLPCGHVLHKLFKGCSQVNTHKYFFSNCVVEIWNALPSTVVAASGSNVFKRMLDCVDLAKFCL